MWAAADNQLPCILPFLWYNNFTYAPVAQGTEQRTSNPSAVGSIPTGRAKLHSVDVHINGG